MRTCGPISQFWWVSFAFFLFTSSFVASAQTISDLRNLYVGKTAVLRGLYSAAELKFDKDGNLIGNVESVSWTTAQLEITDLDFKHDLLIVKGKRKALVPAPDGSMQPIYQGVRDRWEKPTDKPDKATLQIEASDRTQWGGVLRKILVVDQAEWKSVAPEYWRDYLGHRTETPMVKAGEVFRTMADGSKVYKCGGTVRCPKPLRTPDPEYSEPARRARYSAKATFEFVVNIDGRPQDIQILKPAGLGLDENGIRSLQEWQFTPATLDGKPVPVLLNVEILWNLY